MFKGLRSALRGLNKEVMDYLWNNTHLIIPKLGDFSFIDNKEISKSLNYDYIIFNKLNSWDLLLNKDQFFWEVLKIMLYQKHTKESLENNIFYLEYIYRNNWTEFVINYYNRKNINNKYE